MRNGLLARIIIGFFFVTLLAIIVYKAVFVPITFDESAAAIFYPHFTVREIIMYPTCWPSNHILNTLLIKLSESFFGMEPWSVRLPNVLAFVLCFYTVYLIAIRYFDRSFFLFCLPFCIVFCNPFLLDFFGLARGYGISNTCMACSIYCVLRYSSGSDARWCFSAIILAMLAAYANFTLLIYWVAVQGLLLILSFIAYFKRVQSLRKLVIIIFFTLFLVLGFLALCYTPLHKMQSTNQFVYWSKESFFKDTLLDQVNNFRNGVKYFGIPSFYAAYAVILVWVSSLSYVVWKVSKQRLSAFEDPLVIVTLLLLLVWIVNMAQTVILGTPYLSTRTALSYYVLFAFVLMFLIRDLSERIPWVHIGLLPLVVMLFSLHLAFGEKIKSVREWWFDANNHDVLVYLETYLHEHPERKIIELNTTWLFNPSFQFYVSTGKVPWLNLVDEHHEIDSNSTTLFYYATPDDAKQLNNYSPDTTFLPTKMILLKHK